MRLILLSFLFCLGASAQLPEDRPPWLNGRPLLEDTFATPLAAGSVNGTYSTGRAPGLRTVTDAGNKISVATNTAYFSGGSATTVLSYPPVTRAAGRVLKGIAVRGSNTSDITFGFGQTNNSWPFQASFDCDISTLALHDGSATGVNCGSVLSLNTQYSFLVDLRSKGSFDFIKGGAYSQWTLLYPFTSDSTSVLFPDVNQFNGSQTCTFSNILIPKTLWLPSPIASDSFTRANGALGVTDGNGTQERNGGAGLTWNAPGWVISGNTAVAGNTVVADGVTSGLVGRWQLDTATGATDLSGNGNNGTGQGGISIGAATDRRGVANRATTFTAASSQYVSVPALSALQNASTFSISCWLKRTGNSDVVDISSGTDSSHLIALSLFSDGNAYFQVRNGGVTFGNGALTGTLWHHFVLVFNGSLGSGLRITGYVDGKFFVNAASAPSTSANVSANLLIGSDTITPTYANGNIVDVRVYNRALASSEVVQIYLAGATALCTNSTANVVAETSFTGSTSPSGLVLNYDGATGTNLLTSYFDGNGNVKVDQTVNGNTTNLISGAVTYVANARLLTVSAPSEGQVRVYYNNALVNSSTGIWPGFTNFTQHGLYSQGAGSFTNFANFARGSEGQYSILDKLP